jgi:hypothetical protein
MLHSSYVTKTLAFALCLTTAMLTMAQTAMPPAAPHMLIIHIIDGANALNNIQARVAREPIVEVDDENRKPVAGALVLFRLPDSGAGGTFANGSLMLTVTTDAKGQAHGTGLQPNGIQGAFQIMVTATYEGITSNSETINQTNTPDGKPIRAKVNQPPPHVIAKWPFIVGAAVAGAAAGIAIGVTQSGGSSSHSVTITPGAGAVGPPH